MSSDYWEKLIVSPETSVFQALKTLNEGTKQIVLVADEDKKLLGVATDADFRRATLSFIPYNEPVSSIYNKQPVIAFESNSEQEIHGLMKITGRHQIPIINKEGVIKGLRTLNDFIRSSTLDTEVVIMAGGKGKRLLPITRSIPKPLVCVNGKPILFSLLDNLLESGFRKIRIAVNYKKEIIKSALGKNATYKKVVSYVEEKKPLGTGGALSLLQPRPKDCFLVINGDLITTIDFKAFLNYHKSNKFDLTVAVRKDSYELPYGVITLEENRIKSIDEKPVKTFFVNSGVYVINPDIINLVEKNVKLDLPDLVNKCISKGLSVGSFPIHEYWIDIGRHAQLEQAERDCSAVKACTV